MSVLSRSTQQCHTVSRTTIIQGIYPGENKFKPAALIRLFGRSLADVNSFEPLHHRENPSAKYRLKRPSADGMDQLFDRRPERSTKLLECALPFSKLRRAIQFQQLRVGE